MRLIFSALFLSLFLAGCNNLDGQLNVSTDFKLKNSKGDTHLIRVGTYTADLGTSTFGKKINLKLNNDSDEKFQFTIPDGAKIPSNGEFTLKSNQIGQAVDLSGNVTTKVTDSDIKQDFVSCTYTEPVTVCYPGPNGQQSCSTQMRTMYGNQFIRYYDRFMDQTISMNLYPAGTAASAAEFSGHATNVQRIVISQTQCR